MCVILFAETTRPTPEMVEKAWNRNKDGAGIAWREPAKKPTKHRQTDVVWRKGLSLAEVQELAATVPLPFVAHFRIASCGGVRPSLCHPFPIQLDSPLYLSGRTNGAVLFHNGHYGAWKSDLKQSLIAAQVKMPDDKFSDTRAMAIMCAMYGHNFLELIDEKGIVFGPESIEIFKGSNGWYNIDGVWASNDLFVSGYHNAADPTGAYGGGARSTQESTTVGSFSGNRANTHRICQGEKCNIYARLNDDGLCPMCAREKAKKISEQHTSTAAAGGADAVDPFVAFRQAEAAFKAGTGSKNAMKRARRAMEIHMEKERKAALKASAAAPPQSETTPSSVVH